MEESFPLVGIDYGSKLAGTTVIAFTLDRKQLDFISSRKGEDADIFIMEHLLKIRPKQVFIDAPLSLPGVYANLPACSDYFYRTADRELNAMSPMFLGGLTARAMQLSAQLKNNGISCIEVYPAALARFVGLRDMGYKKEKEKISNLLEYIKTKNYLPYPCPPLPSWHFFDALLALMSGHRFEQQLVAKYGNEKEGIIYV